ncbi:DNA polymerase IV [Nesterenkonia xinjiangensis]|uniref:DNA polymerase IV n=1 Tax=Nesterenkonia xinjiangensis TaxID=225327 RepID=A0A7Z0GNG6_9MICC|nr:DNA polymerase IV [Nesterenkonia xinjiangensis]NYJ79244.1 DNA polymerase-4 [Nesterenkonia xinjiangensis]
MHEGTPSRQDRRPRILAHVDMDAYFVEVELLERPELRGRKLIVAQDSGRSVVLSASYEARADGVRSAMPLGRARQLSPRALILPPHPLRYREFSLRIMEYFGTVTDAVEQLSVDEAFLDLTGARRRLGTPEEIGRTIRREVREQFGLPCTVGIADRKFIAKIASTRAKPDGLLVVPPSQRLDFLHSLPVRALWGVGGTTAAALEQLGISTVRQLAETPEDLLRRRFGVTGSHLRRLAWGDDERTVQPHREEKSIGAEETFAQDVSSTAELHEEILRLSHRIAARLRAAGMSAQGISLKLRYRDFETLTRSATLTHPTQSALTIRSRAAVLLDRLGPRAQPVRLIGIRAERLHHDGGALQLSFDRAETNWIDAENVLDAVARRFPSAAVGPASLLRSESGGREDTDAADDRSSAPDDVG